MKICYIINIAITAFTVVTPRSIFAQDERNGIALGERESLLKIEDFASRSGGITLNYGVTYSSQDKNGYLPGIVHVLSSDGSVLLVPAIQETGDRSDSVVGNIGVRYNVDGLFNLSAQVSGGFQNDRITNAVGVSQSSSAIDFNSLVLGADVTLTPASSRLFANAFISTGVIEKSVNYFQYGRSLTGGVTGYWVADPLIFSTTVTYTGLFERETARGRIDPGDVVTLTPTVGFAANPDVNLSWGMGFAAKQGEKRENHQRSDWDMLSTINFGVGYRLNKDMLLNITGKAGVSGNDAVQVGVNISQRF
ncbi:hypothetical protein [Agrobacterium sp. UNC420CL41Cvi]|uniref:hypothetical protein n=1 Tax=Agrobacterium sp. UNC420CL41Cvi TaxID=1340437 RepID=UPI0012DE4DF7|nr:hypothetical protein [Agrobacterium sp. UNC420CL41Cvi]